MAASGALTILEEMINSLPPSEKKIARYILSHPDDTLSLTALQLGEKSETSSAAVIRLCKSLGFKGFQQLKLKLAGDLQKSDSDGYRDIKPGESTSEVVFKMTNNSIQTIKETSELLELDDLEKAVNAIAAAGNIHFYGVGASHIIARDAQLKFSRINKKVTAFSDLHVAATHVANVEKGDVVFGISFSGNTYEVERILQLANKHQATTIALTRFGPSPVAKVASLCLRTSVSKEATFRSGATSSRLAQLHVLDILFMSVANQEYDQVISHLDETREAIKFIQSDRLKRSQSRGRYEE